MHDEETLGADVQDMHMSSSESEHEDEARGDTTPHNPYAKSFTPRTHRNPSESAPRSSGMQPRLSSDSGWANLFGRPGVASWACHTCTLIHGGEQAAFLACGACGTERPISS